MALYHTTICLETHVSERNFSDYSDLDNPDNRIVTNADTEKTIEFAWIIRLLGCIRENIIIQFEWGHIFDPVDKSHDDTEVTIEIAEHPTVQFHKYRK